MSDRALLQQALDALIAQQSAIEGVPTGPERQVEWAIEALRAELDKPQGEPAWRDVPNAPGLWWSSFSNAARQITAMHIEKGSYVAIGARWYGPISEDTEKTE